MFCGSCVKIFSNFGYWWLHLANVKRQLEWNYLHLKWRNQRFEAGSFTKKENCIWTVTNYEMQSPVQGKCQSRIFLHQEIACFPSILEEAPSYAIILPGSSVSSLKRSHGGKGICLLSRINCTRVGFLTDSL